MSLTETWLKAHLNKPKDKIQEFSDRDSMSVRVSAKGKITFQLRYRYLGKPCRVDLGIYPHTSLKEARTLGDSYRAYLSKGNDPRGLKLQCQIEQGTQYTFEKLFREWFEKYCKPKKKHAVDVGRAIEMYVLPVFGNRYCDSITVRHWFDLLEKITKTVPTVAGKVLGNCRQCLSWGYKRELIKHNPLIGVSAKEDLNIKDVVKDRVLSAEELQLIFKGIDNFLISSKNKVFIQLLLIYGCRVNELKFAKKADFDLVKGIWTVPVENHKAGNKTRKPIQRPIPQEVMPYVLKALGLNVHSEYVFTHLKTNEPLSVKGHASLIAPLLNQLAKGGKAIPTFSVHDLRRTMRTHISEFTEPHIAELMLGHTLPTVWRTYDKHTYLKEQAKAYSQWVKKLESI